MLIRESPATELAVASRILARAGALASDGAIALRVGTDVVYLPAAGAAAATLTPYDVAAVHLDGTPLYGTPSPSGDAYVAALRAAPEARAVAARADGLLVVTPSLRACVEALLGRPYDQLEAEARATGALFGAYPYGDDPSTPGG